MDNCVANWQCVRALSCWVCSGIMGGYCCAIYAKGLMSACWLSWVVEVGEAEATMAIMNRFRPRG